MKAVESVLLQAVGTSELNVDEVARVDNKIQNVIWATWRNSFAIPCVFVKMVIDRRPVCFKPNAKAHSSYTHQTDASSVALH